MDQNPKAIEIFSWKISKSLMEFLILCLWPKIYISDILCETIPKRWNETLPWGSMEFETRRPKFGGEDPGKPGK